jgi:hypothetical protein
MMRKRVIYAACSIPAWVDVATLLQRDNGWDPIYWIGRPHLKPLLEVRFPGIAFHEHGEAMWARGLPPSQVRIDKPLEAALLAKLGEVESQTLRMMDRIDYAGLLDHGTRRDMYYDMVRYWIAVLDQYRPDILFNPSTPHQMYDFVLQELCRLRGIPTLMLGLGFDLNLVFAKDDYTQGSGAIGSVYKARLAAPAAAHAPLLPEIEARFSRVTRSYDEAMPAFLVKQLQEDHKQPRAWNWRGVAKAIRDLLGGAGRLAAVLSSSDPRKGVRVQAVLRDARERLYHDLIGPLRLENLRRHYDDLAAAPDFDRPFIYLPLAFQPEQSSAPEGGAYADQYLIAHMLSRAVPPGWQILVKEHPSQFTYIMGTNRPSRSYRFYDDLAALPNVRLLPLSTNPFALIDNAMAVATVTGTSGWEALVRGKPVLHFGYPWWQGCEGAFYTPDLDACRRALGLVQQGYRVDSKKVRLFAQVTAEVSCSGDLYWNRDLHALSSQDSTRVAEVVRQMASLLGDFERSARSTARALAGGSR